MSIARGNPVKIGENNKIRMPHADAIGDAVKTLNDQLLAVYQLLYAEGLASPGNRGPFAISRVLGSSGSVVSPLVRISPAGYEEEGYGFNTRDIEGVLDRVKLIESAIHEGRKKISFRACCPLATHRHCVCLESFDCPIHGGTCHGTHD